MEDHIKQLLGTSVFKSIGTSGGCISQGNAYEIDDRKIFVKLNSKSGAGVMFKGEYESLKAIWETKKVRVPEPLLVGDFNSRSYLVMEYFDLRSLNKSAETLGKAIANLHLHNNEIDKFGFHTSTCCGYIPLNNEWCDDWVRFYANQRLDEQIKRIQEERGDREVGELWSQLQLKIPDFFKDVEIKPALLHGDLWSGNAGEVDGEPVIFDPASFYGHSEFDLSIAKMFGGFGSKFFSAYHEVIPKANGFEKREDLYLLFHHLNHWNHFGNQYKSSTLSIMKKLIKA